MTKHTFTFMGTAAGCGVPAFFCECPACTEARENPKLARGDCGVMIQGEQTLVIDTPPDARHQLIREGVTKVDRILMTHCHSDHVSGLCEYEYMVQLKNNREPLPLYGSAETIAEIEREFHYMTYALELHVMAPFETVEFDGVRYTALPATHAPGTFGYLIETDTTRMFYASDTGTLQPKTADAVRGCDILAMDATFWKRCWHPENHHSVQGCIEEGLALDAKKIYLTHMCMHYDEPVTYAQLCEYLEQFGGRVQAAMDGMKFEI